MKNPGQFLNNRFLAVKPERDLREVKFNAVEKRAPGPKFINKKNESRMKLEKELEERYRPNVHTYSPDDRKVKNKLPLFSFPKGHKGERTPSPDRKKALFVNDKLTKKNATKVAILPEHNITEKQLLKEFESGRLGPASYEPTHELVEARNDKGVLKMRKPTESVERDNMEKVLDLHPNFDYDKPNKLTFQYHEPSNVRPIHTPEKELNPGKWKFYDFDLDVIKEEVAKDINFARNLNS